MMQILPQELKVATRNTLMAARQTMADITPDYLPEIKNTWNDLRWTRRVTRAFCVVQLGEARSSFFDAQQKCGLLEGTHGQCASTSTPKQRMQHHTKVYQTVFKRLTTNTVQMRKRAARIEIHLQNAVASEPAA